MVSLRGYPSSNGTRLAGCWSDTCQLLLPGTVPGMDEWELARGAVCAVCSERFASRVAEVIDSVAIRIPELRMAAWAPCRCSADSSSGPEVCAAWADGPAAAEVLAGLKGRVAALRHLTLQGRVYALRSGQIPLFTTPTRLAIGAVALPTQPCLWSVYAAQVLHSYGSNQQGWVGISRALAELTELSTDELSDVAALAGSQPGISVGELVQAARVLS